MVKYDPNKGCRSWIPVQNPNNCTHSHVLTAEKRAIIKSGQCFVAKQTQTKAPTKSKILSCWFMSKNVSTAAIRHIFGQVLDNQILFAVFSKSFWNMTQKFSEPRFNCFWVGEIGAKVMKFTFTNKFYGWACNSDDSLFTMKPPSIYEYSWDPLKLMCLHGNFKFKGLFELFVTAFKHPSSCSTDCVLIDPMFWIW